MKKLLSKLYMVGALAGLTLLASCGGDDDPVLPAGPGIEFSTNPASTDNEVTIAVGEELTLSASVTTPGGFNVARVSGSVANTNVTGEVNRNDLSLDAGAESASFSFGSITFTEAGTGVLIFEVVDDLSQTATEELTVNVVGTPLNESTVILLGGQQNANTGSFYDAITETVFTATQAFMVDNTDKVDFVFWYGTTSLNAIGAVNDANAQIAFNTQNITLDNLNPKSISKFKTFTAIQDFDGTTTSEQLEALFPSDGTGDLSRVGELAVGDIFGVTLDAGRGSKKGLIKVEEIIGTTPTTRAIKIKVKMQN